MMKEERILPLGIYDGNNFWFKSRNGGSNFLQVSPHRFKLVGLAQSMKVVNGGVEYVSNARRPPRRTEWETEWTSWDKGNGYQGKIQLEHKPERRSPNEIPPLFENIEGGDVIVGGGGIREWDKILHLDPYHPYLPDWKKSFERRDSLPEPLEVPSERVRSLYFLLNVDHEDLLKFLRETSIRCNL